MHWPGFTTSSSTSTQKDHSTELQINLSHNTRPTTKIPASSSHQAMTSAPTEPIAFPFLSLIPELRNKVYRFALLSRPLRLGHGKFDRWWQELGLLANSGTPKESDPPCINLLLVSHQVHEEASHILYYHGRFLTSYFIFNKPFFKAPNSGLNTLTENHSNFAGLASRDERFRQIRHIEGKINWVRAQCTRSPQRVRTGRLSNACENMSLSTFQHLQTITISWQSYSADPARPDTRVHKVPLRECENVHRVLDLLYSFRAFQISRPNVTVTIRMPSVKLESTTDTKEQGAYKGLIEYMKEVEDVVQKENAKDYNNISP